MLEQTRCLIMDGYYAVGTIGLAELLHRSRTESAGAIKQNQSAFKRLRSDIGQLKQATGDCYSTAVGGGGQPTLIKGAKESGYDLRIV